MAQRPIDGSNPGYVRQIMHTYYERYHAGIDVFPKLRFKSEATSEQFPRKTQPIAAALLRAWRVIIEDKDYFAVATQRLMDEARLQKEKRNEPFNGLSIVRIGRNAVRMAMVAGEPGKEELKVDVLEERRDNFLETFGGLVLNIGDDKLLTIASDMLSANRHITPTEVVIRESNVSGMYVASNFQTAF